MSTQLQESHAFHGISLHITVTVAPENVDKYLESFKTCFDAVTAEPECTFFEVYANPETPGHFKWVENWSRDKEWLLKNQMTKDYYKPYMEVAESLMIKPQEVEIFNRMPAGWTRVKAENMKEGWM